VKKQSKKLIKDIGKNGGLVIFPNSAMDYAKPENVKTMVETVKKYEAY